MSVKWNELIAQKPRELVFSGKTATKQIEDENGLNELVFRISTLNFLEISKTNLIEIPAKIEQLSNLTNLVLSGNKLSSIPSAIGKLNKLKLLDVSNNELQALPEEIGGLTDLQSLLVNMNQLTALPSSLVNLSNLHIIKLDQNKLEKFPCSLCSDNLKNHLSEIHASHNQIEDIPSDIGLLLALKVLDLSENRVKDVPGELSNCAKMKDLNLKGNKLSDRRLLKLVEQGKQKQILDYIKAHCAKKSKSEGGDNSNGVKRSRGKDSVSDSNGDVMDTIKILPGKTEDRRSVVATQPVNDVRKIVACIVRNVNLEGENTLKKFIQLQTSLHETLCNKRQSATIASHDLSKIEGTLVFDLKPPTKLKIVPLGKSKEMSGSELYKSLNEEAELYRKEKKRTTYSGIHKYLYLLKGKQRYPCLMDEKQVVISFPPLTNSNVTRISKETKDLLMEVTGESTPKCKEVMDALLHEMVKIPLQSNAESGTHILEVEPMKVVDVEGKLNVLYPSKIDLNFTDVNIVREMQ